MDRYRHAGLWLSLHRLMRRIRHASGFRILMLHDVPDHQMEALAGLVDYVAHEHGVLSPDDAAAWMYGQPFTPPAGKLGRPPVLFSFDDGFASNVRVAHEILEPAGIRALFFVCPGLIELEPAAQREAIAENIFDGRVSAADMDAELRLMTWDEVAALSAAGHVIGAHSMTHRRLTTLSGDDLRTEIFDSGVKLEGRLDVPVGWFAYPFGDIGSIDKHARSVIAQRYPFCRSGVRGANRMGTLPLGLLADHIDLDAPMAYQRLVLEGGLDLRYIAKRWRLNSAVMTGRPPS
jgi:peptidoglycan/xylan/chitin deacetylase (PgdA/CDA1 family)